MARINKQGNKARAVPAKASKKMDVLIKDANPAPPSALLLFLQALASDLALQFCLCPHPSRVGYLSYSFCSSLRPVSGLLAGVMETQQKGNSLVFVENSGEHASQNWLDPST